MSKRKGKRRGAEQGDRAETLHDFHKFPRTRHIYSAGGTGVTRDDLVGLNQHHTLRESDTHRQRHRKSTLIYSFTQLMTKGEAKVFHNNTVTVEEKVDGTDHTNNGQAHP